MKPTLVFRRDAQREFDEAAAWYEVRRSGLGIDFVKCVEETLESIVEQPDRFPTVSETVREAPVRRFPYCVYYRVKPGRIVIIAVFHLSRDPAAWQKRTSDN